MSNDIDTTGRSKLWRKIGKGIFLKRHQERLKPSSFNTNSYLTK
uniref:Uncharacterized protein n=1 Tax=Anguilla anguilla TaxID=7936 RepID=A0A0E9PT27_ANGAN